MSDTQMRVQIPSDFEDITLYGPNEIREKEWNRQRLPSNGDFANSFNPPVDPHYSVASTSSTVSTPTLASDTSSLRSSLSSQSSPNISHSSTNNISTVPLQEIKEVKHTPSSSVHTSSGFNRRKSVSTLVDNTSMASLTIKSQPTPRSRKQREMDFDADQDDDIWPGDSLMFNVPMSPALYAQQKMKHYQMNSLPSPNHHPASPPSGNQHPFNNPGQMRMRSHSQYDNVPPHAPLNHIHVKKRQGAQSRSSNQYAPPVPLMHHNGNATAPKRSSGLRHSISSNDDNVSPTHTRANSTSSRNSGFSSHVDADHEYAHHDEMSYTKQPGYYTPANVSAVFDEPRITHKLSTLFSRNGSASGRNMSINGLDPDASDLTLDLFELEEVKERTAHGLSHDNGFGNNVTSISQLAMSDNGDESLPVPIGALGIHDPDSSGSQPSSRRSSITRPDNLPPKDPEEEKKHLKEYEKLLRDAAIAEKKKQQKKEEEAKKRMQQTKIDLNTWSTWLGKGCKGSLSSDLKWRGIPDKIRPIIWNYKLGSAADGKGIFSKQLPPFQLRHNFNYIQNEIIEDSERIWPECNIFGKGRPFHGPLIEVIRRFMGIRKEIPYSFELVGIAAVLLLQLSEDDSVRAMLTLLEPGKLAHAILTGNERIASANYVTFSKLFKSKFPQLSKHFEKVDLTTTELLNPLIGGYFTTMLPQPEFVTRVLDVYIFEGDSFLLRAALGIIRLNEAFFYGSKQDILFEMNHLRISSEDGLMTTIRDVTRK